MEEEEVSCIYVPLWVFGIGFFVLSLIGCTNVAHTPTKQSDLAFHSCPKQGHGDCPICCDSYRNENYDEKTLVLD